MSSLRTKRQITYNILEYNCIKYENFLNLKNFYRQDAKVRQER